MPELAERAVRAARACALPAAIAGVALVAVLAGSLFRDVYHGIPDSIAVAAITATCCRINERFAGKVAEGNAATARAAFDFVRDEREALTRKVQARKAEADA